ncbi:alpha-L-glutamate ligases/ RimK family protein [Synechococcus sp. RS9907]|nr:MULTISPECIES: 30S ribosomal protein S6--L-glutamate ligase [unclassified Synechococcus]QNI64100.1 alpha-L-glutamate ligases/ RimK family protein [Synechococcus sp. A15-44]QNI82863.1 alpha-L-glutamate ligases/ RimK family protein [Synechococcus sp. RS9907]
MTNKLIVGSEEWCSLPGLGLPAIKARVDSGAATSSLHAFNIVPFQRDGELWISFEVHPLQNDRSVVVRHEAPVLEQRSVRNTSGISENRYVIREELVLGEQRWPIELTLTNRDAMGYRMLLGREAMVGRVLVDPEGSHQLGDVEPAQLEAMYAALRTERTGLRIALLASDPELYSNRRLLEAGEERGHRMEFLNVKQCYMRLDPQNPEMHYRGGNVLERIDAVIPRIRPSVTFYGCAITRQFESMGIRVLNAAEPIKRSRDKLLASQLFVRHGLSMPVTGFASSPLDTKDLIKMVGGAPLILKLLEGAQGRGVVLAETQKAAESVINAMKSLNANLLVQEFIKEAGGKDLRCFVIGNKVVSAIERTAAVGDFRSNIHQGGSAQAVRIRPEERKLAVAATRALGLDVAGVDIIRSERGPLLLEVNSSPGLEGIETATGKDLAGQMIQEVERKLGWVRSCSTPALVAS